MRKISNGKEYADNKYHGFRIWVSKDGQSVVKGRKDDRLGKPLEVLYDFDGPFVLSQDTDGIRIDVAPVIIHNFGTPAPADGKKYMIHWKDGDKHNNDVSNLEWVPFRYRHSNADKEYLYEQNNLVEVRRDGSIWTDHHSSALNVIDQHFESDTWLRFPDKKVFVTLDYQHPMFVEDLMGHCGFVQGDYDSLTDPVILHKDNNYRNCAADNLEWVEKDDPRYDAFLEQRLKDRMEVYHRENGNQRLPHKDYITESKDGYGWMAIL